jgi:hypothetical protein
MDKRNSSAVTSDYNEQDPIEDFHFAIENWEKTRKYKQTESHNINSRKPNSAYTHGDPVSMAYSSQFKPIKSGSPKSSPRLKITKTRQVSEIQAAYGLSSPQITSSSSNTTTETRESTSQGSGQGSGQGSETNSKKNLTKEGTAPVAVAMGGTGTVEGGGRVSSAPSSDEPRYKATEKSRSPESALQPHPPPRTNPQRVHSSTVPQSAPSSASATSSAQTNKSSYRRRSDQMRSSQASEWKEPRHTSRPSNEITITTELTSQTSDCENVDEEDSASAVKTAGGVTYSNSYELEANPRPQSRKLYLGGNTGSPRSGIDFQTENISDVPSSASSSSTSHGMRAPRSAGTLSRHNLLSPDLRPSHSSKELTNSDLSNTSSIILSSPWGHGNSTNFNERPPSRQRTAFPVHLADRDHSKRVRSSNHRNSDTSASNVGPTNPTSSNGGVGTASSSHSRKGAFIETDEAIDANAAAAPSTLRGVGGLTLATNSNDMMLESPSGRPPSRQKVAAQYLWGDEASFDHDATCHSKSHPSSDTSPDGLVSPLLTPTMSAGGISLMDPEMYSRVSSSPTLLMSNSSQSMSGNNFYDRGDQSRGSIAPMYDPTADGFTQLENRSQSAPFKIRVGPLSCLPLSPHLAFSLSLYL